MKRRWRASGTRFIASANTNAQRRRPGESSSKATATAPLRCRLRAVELEQPAQQQQHPQARADQDANEHHEIAAPDRINQFEQELIREQAIDLFNDHGKHGIAIFSSGRQSPRCARSWATRSGAMPEPVRMIDRNVSG